ncbi:type IV secretory system conjugative DNA transfer family protein [Mesorhizobium sp. ASY16-5R]|uniref:type IV secretory system conjugative DNA transfer family protein n=1 Tax=Mesorhizobium sp. ASY16-5R TaxID=3445772 RepID=UPI003F9F2111
MKKLGYLDQPGFLMAVSEKKRKRVYNNPERAVLMMAPPGTGKSQHFIAHLRSLVKRKPEKLPFLLIGDAADELYTNCAPMLTAAGYQIAKLDVVDPEGWSKFDILSHLNPADRFVYGRQLDAVCRLLVPDEPGSKQPHFLEFMRLLLKCAITLNVRYEANDKPIGVIIGELINEKKRAAMLKRAVAFDDDVLTTALDTMGKMQDKPEGISMLSTSLRKIESWSDDALREVTSYGPDLHGRYSRGWKFEDMFRSEKPVAIFLRTGTQKMGGDFARIVYGNAINTVAMMLDRDKKRLSRDLEVLIDEAGLVGYCDAVTHAYTRLRKAGVRIRMCFLGLQEFRETYSKEHATLLGGSDLLVFGGSNDLEQNRLVSDLLGEFTVQSRSESQSDNGESRGRSEQPRKLQKYDEVRMLGYSKVLAIMDGIAVLGLKPWQKGKRGIEYL